MTDQYLPTNINAPRASRLITESAPLTLDDDLVVVENLSAGPIELVLPDATQIPAREIKFKADTLTNPVVIGTIGGQTIDGNATISLTTDQESVCLKSDGTNWRQVCGGGSGGAPARAVLPVYDDSAPSGPSLSYSAEAGGNRVFVIQGENLTGIVAIGFRLVTVGAPPLAPPTVVGAPVVTDTTITVTVDTAGNFNGEYWGIILFDADGNVYGCPSPLKIWVGE